MVLYGWDPRKAEENRRKHGFRLSDGIPALNDPRQVGWIDERFDHGEEGTVALARAGGRLSCVVHVPRGPDRLRIVSARRVTRGERNAYRDVAAR